MGDTRDLKFRVRKGVRVRVPPRLQKVFVMYAKNESRCYLDNDAVEASALLDAEDCVFCGKAAVNRTPDDKLVCSECLEKLNVS